MCVICSSEIYLQIIPLFFIIKKWLNSHLRLKWQPGLSWVSSPSPTVFPLSVVFSLLPLPSTANLMLQQSVANVPPAPVQFHYRHVQWGVVHWQVIKKPNDLLTDHHLATRLIITLGSTIKSDAKDCLTYCSQTLRMRQSDRLKLWSKGVKYRALGSMVSQCMALTIPLQTLQ